MPSAPKILETEKIRKKIKSSVPRFDEKSEKDANICSNNPENDISVTLDSNGLPKAVAFFDIDGTLADVSFIHGMAIKKLFKQIFEEKELEKMGLNTDDDFDKLVETYKAGFTLGTTFRVFDRLIQIYRDGKNEFKDPQAYLEWLQDHQDEIDGSGPAHEFAARISLLHSEMGAEIAEELYRRDPDIFLRCKIKPVFHLARLYQRQGIPMVIMTANDDPFAQAVCKCLGLADMFIDYASQKDFAGRGKEGAIECLLDKLEQKGIPAPEKLIVVGDSQNGDVGSGAKFKEMHGGNVVGVLVGEGEITEIQERVANDAMLKDMPVEILVPGKVAAGMDGMPLLSAYRKDYDTKFKKNVD